MLRENTVRIRQARWRCQRCTFSMSFVASFYMQGGVAFSWFPCVWRIALALDDSYSCELQVVIRYYPASS